MKPFRLRMAFDPDARRRIQYARAERIASALVDYGWNKQLWELYFRVALRETQRFDKEFEGMRR